MYAVIRTGGKQYRVGPGDVVRVEKLPGEVGEEISFDDILMVGGDEGEPVVGQPNVKGAKVSGKIVAQDRAKKITVFKHKRRKGYRLKQGHRQYYTGVEIDSVDIATKKSAPKKAKSDAEAAASEETD